MLTQLDDCLRLMLALKLVALLSLTALLLLFTYLLALTLIAIILSVFHAASIATADGRCNQI